MKSVFLFPGILLVALSGALSTAAYAHTGQGTSGVLEGLAHPLGPDHLLAMFAVGMWSVSALPATKAWGGPVTFMVALVASAFLGLQGVTLPDLESLISLSLVLFGIMLILARFQIAPLIGLMLVALAASVHGLAHGAESPESGFMAYAAGFLFTTACLHFGGVVVGQGIKQYLPDMGLMLRTVAGLLLGGAGIYLFSQ